MVQLSVFQYDRLVILRHEKMMLRLSWRVADELADALRDASRCAADFGVPGAVPFADRTIQALAIGFSMIVRQKEDRVEAIGPWVMDLEHQNALLVSQALRTCARGCEELEKANEIVEDNAVLFRSGAPFGLSNNKKIQEETVKFALGDRDLRRFMPGIKSEEVLGTPTLSQEQPPALDAALKIAGRMTPEERRRFAAAHGGN